jgi:hypothetical protein
MHIRSTLKKALTIPVALIAALTAVFVTSAGPASAQGFSFPLFNTAFAFETVPHTTFVTNQAWQEVAVDGQFTAVNSATAIVANCPDTPMTACNAEAIAFQIIIDSHASTGLNFTNHTLSAVDARSTGASAFTWADQWVLESTGHVSLTPAGEVLLAQIHANITAVLASPTPQAFEVQYFQQDVEDVLTNDVVVSPPGSAHWWAWKGAANVATLGDSCGNVCSTTS